MLYTQNQYINYNSVKNNFKKLILCGVGMLLFSR